MKNFIDQLWKSLNIILMILIVGSAAYFYIMNPEQMFGKRAQGHDVSVNDVRQNSQYSQTVGWGEGFIQDPVNVNNQPDVQTVANPNNNYNLAQSLDPYGIQQIARPNMNPAPNTRTAALNKILQEGHWIGLEVIPLISTIAKANNIPDNISGVLVDEVTLVAAASGLLAGDVITAIDGVKVVSLSSFKQATAYVASLPQSIVTVYRNGNYMDIAVNAGEQLGIAQMEAAPMILPTDASPHGYYGPCDRCHSISKSAKNTGQLRKDAGDVLTVAAPPIKWGIESTHRNRGTCTNCHSVI